MVDKLPNLATLSDEEIMNLDPTDYAEEPETSDKPEDDQAEDKSEETSEEEEDETEDSGGTDASEDTPPEEDEESDETSEEEDDDEGNAEETSDEPTEDDDDDQSSEESGGETEEVKNEETEATDEIDYKAELAKVLAPFKAAKRTIKVGSPEQARRLMQMGVDYTKKMEAMKPFQKVLKTLQNNDLIDLDKVNFLIDLDKKNPAAIKKFLKDSKIDPVELDLEGGEPYTPADYTASDNEVELDNVIDDLKGDANFQQIIDVVTNEWDKESRQELFKNPRILRTLTAHANAGIYEMITERLANERVYGGHMGLTDLVAYKAVGDAMFEEGAFNKPTPGTPTPNDTARQGSQAKEGTRASDDKKRRTKRKKAAGSPRGGARAGKKMPNLDTMTDKEIEEFDLSSL